MRLTTAIKWALLLSLAVAIALWISTAVFWSFAFRFELLIGCAFILAGAFLLALPCAACMERGRHVGFMTTGLTAAIGGGIGAVLLTFVRDLVASSPLAVAAADALAAVGVWAGFCALVATLVVRRFTNRFAVAMRRVTVAAAAALGVMVLAVIWFPDVFWYGDEVWLRLLGVLGVTTLFGLCVTQLLSRLDHLDADADAPDEDVIRLDIEMRCPRCALHQTITTGGARCRGCGLHVKVLVP